MHKISVIIAAAVGLSAAVHGAPALAYAYDGGMIDASGEEASSPSSGPLPFIDTAEQPIIPQPSDELLSSVVSDPAVWRLAHDMATQPSVAVRQPAPAPTSFQDSIGSGALGLSMVGAGMIAWVFQRRREAEADEIDDALA
jgi:hypothetical protein